MFFFPTILGMILLGIILVLQCRVLGDKVGKSVNGSAPDLVTYCVLWVVR